MGYKSRNSQLPICIMVRAINELYHQSTWALTGFSACLSHFSYSASWLRYLWLGYSEVNKKERVWNRDLKLFYPKGPGSKYVRLCKPYTGYIAYSSHLFSCLFLVLFFHFLQYSKNVKTFLRSSTV